MNASITRENAVSPVDATAQLSVSSDKMEALLMLRPPQDGGGGLSRAQLDALLAESGVVYGIRTDKLDKLAEQPEYNKPVVVARGVHGIQGTDAVIVCHVDLNRSLAPKVRADGTVDFKDLNIVQAVARGDVLQEKQPATKGTPGLDVCGKVLPVKPGKDLPLAPGKNTELSQDGLRVLATIDGQASVAGKKINVLDVFTVNGDVSHATGNIHFAGNVVVTGGVHAGFEVHAGGNVDIYGTVDTASVTAGGVLVVRGGFTGGRTGTLVSGASMSCRFIQGGKITAGGDLEATYILNATVLCSGSINVTGKGLIVGGHIAARTSVSATTLGNANTSAGTIVEVGNDASLVKRAIEIPKELAACEKSISILEVSLKTLVQLKAAGRLTEDNAERLAKASNTYKHLMDKQGALQEEHAEVREKIAQTGQGVVKVLGKAHPGVRIIIGTSQLTLQDVHSFTLFKHSEEGIVSAPAR